MTKVGTSVNRDIDSTTRNRFEKIKMYCKGKSELEL